MKSTKILLVAALATTVFIACKKDPVNNTPQTLSFDELKKAAIADFTNVVAVPTYKSLDEQAQNLYSAITLLNTQSTETNLDAARKAWKDMRSVWEQSESFLFGPVADNDYDPNMDTWPTDFNQMDSLLSSAHALGAAEVQQLTLSLRGYHPIEYILFGNHGDRKAADLTARQKEYMMGLAEDLKNTCSDLHQNWVAMPVNYKEEVINAGSSSIIYPKKQDIYLTLVDAMAGICEEVGEGKMLEPFDTQDPSIVESPYSGNSTKDFKDNIQGIRNVYLCQFGNVSGNSISAMVALRNKALDNKIQNQITAAINSFDNITVPFEHAIISQRVQVQNTMNALAELKTTMETELKPFMLQYIQD